LRLPSMPASSTTSTVRAEAVTLRCQLDPVFAGQGASRAVLLAGDLNDEPEAATTQVLNGPPGSEIGTAGFDRPDRGDGDWMWNLAALIPEGQRFTRVFRGRRELIDHVFASRMLVGLASQVATAVAGPGQLRSVTEHPGAEVGKPGSDHAAVVASFQLPN
jgi:endonuclease/exonuclease/phosphatase family metal-dependent hydrolase